MNFSCWWGDKLLQKFAHLFGVSLRAPSQVIRKARSNHTPQRIQVPSFGLIHKKTLFGVSTDDQKCRVCFINGENFLIIQAALNEYFCVVNVRFPADFCRFLFAQRKFRCCGFGCSDKKAPEPPQQHSPPPPSESVGSLFPLVRTYSG